MAVETLLIGLVLALLWTEITDVSPGGLIVPGYFALYLDEPLRAAAVHVAGEHVQAREELEVLPDGEVAVQAVLLRHEPDPLLPPTGDDGP